MTTKSTCTLINTTTPERAIKIAVSESVNSETKTLLIYLEDHKEAVKEELQKQSVDSKSDNVIIHDYYYDDNIYDILADSNSIEFDNITFIIPRTDRVSMGWNLSKALFDLKQHSQSSLGLQLTLIHPSEDLYILMDMGYTPKKGENKGKTFPVTDTVIDDDLT